MPGVQVIEQRRGLRRVTAWTRREQQTQQTASLIHGHMPLRGQPATRPAQASTRVGVLFFSPRNRRPIDAAG